MKRKKAAQAAVLNNEPVAQNPTEVSSSDGVIDLDSVCSQSLPMETGQLPNLKTEFQVPEHVGETVVLQPGQHAVKTKRKYTKRAKTVGVVATPPYVDRDAIRKARIQVFIEYIDGNRSFEGAAGKDQGLRGLDEMAAQLLTDQKKWELYS